MIDVKAFDDFARRWLLTRSAELAAAMVDVILTGPFRRVPPRYRRIAAALRILRAGKSLPQRDRRSATKRK